MSARDSEKQAAMDRPLLDDGELAGQMDEVRRRHLLLDPHPPVEMARMVLEPMRHAGPVFWVFFVLLGGMAVVAAVTWGYQMWYGLGVTGLRRPVMWAVYIANFVYFLGIGVAGTFISAVLRVLGFQWRVSITRAAETLTVCAVAVSGLFPIIHVGRPWKAYWLLPYPNVREIWPSYHSALSWDLVSVVTYLSSSLLFLWLAMIPDLAMARDWYEKGWRNRLFGLASFGWRGTGQQWRTLKSGIKVFAIAIIPVMILMHSILGWDFAVAIQPGWHSTVFAAVFVAGALLSGAAAVILVLIVMRRPLHLEYFLRDEQLDGMGKLLLVFSLAWAYFYFNEFLVPWYGQEPLDKSLTDLFTTGYAAPLWWSMIFCIFVLPVVTMGFRRIRTSRPAMFFIALAVVVGMWLERYIIVAVTLGRNELPFDWGIYIPRVSEILITVGAFCLLGFLLLVSVKLFPIIPLWEIREEQLAQGVRRVGRAIVPTRAQPE